VAGLYQNMEDKDRRQHTFHWMCGVPLDERRRLRRERLFVSTMDDLARVARPGFKTGLKPHRERRRRIEVDWRWCGGNIT